MSSAHPCHLQALLCSEACPGTGCVTDATTGKPLLVFSDVVLQATDGCKTTAECEAVYPGSVCGSDGTGSRACRLRADLVVEPSREIGTCEANATAFLPDFRQLSNTSFIYSITFPSGCLQTGPVPASLAGLPLVFSSFVSVDGEGLIITQSTLEIVGVVTMVLDNMRVENSTVLVLQAAGAAQGSGRRVLSSPALTPDEYYEALKTVVAGAQTALKLTPTFFKLAYKLLINIRNEAVKPWVSLLGLTVDEYFCAVLDGLCGGILSGLPRLYVPLAEALALATAIPVVNFLETVAESLITSIGCAVLKKQGVLKYIALPLFIA